MCVLIRRDLPVTARTADRARQLCSDHLFLALTDSPSAAQARGDAEMLVDALVTYAASTGAHTVALEVNLHSDHALMSVTDDAPQPKWGLGHGRAATGPGPLSVIDRLALVCGLRAADDGRQLWAVLPLPEQATATLPCLQAAPADQRTSTMIA